MAVEEQIKRLSSLISEMEKRNEAVSKVKVGWHIYHALLVIVKVVRTLEKSELSKKPLDTSMFQRMFFLLKMIPRGKAIAPKAVRPPESFKEEDLNSLADIALSVLSGVPEISALAQFNHPRVGMLNRDKTVKFLGIHTAHHLKIIDDILA